MTSPDTAHPVSLETLSQARAHIRDIQRQPGLGQVALGLPLYDRQLLQLGQERLCKLGSSGASSPGQGPDVILATRLYEDGGHTALIGDFVAALTETGKCQPHLVLTNLFGDQGEPLADRIRLRTGVLPENVHILPGPSLEERLDQLIPILMDLRPHRLFLFQHPDDPLASAVAQPAIAEQRFLIHHADSGPTLGLHLPGTRIIELNPYALADARIRGLPADLLLLTIPDPGPRPLGFLNRGRLITATCGSAHKYDSEYLYSYADVVAVILETTGGWHVHIGPLDDDQVARISDALHRARLDTERFIHIPWVPSLAEALWQHQCDVYIASFPVDGARAYVDVAASATPYLSHRRARSRARDGLAITPKSAVWRNLDELADVLRSMSGRDALEKHARFMRKVYDEYHHPQVFRRTLHSIIAGKGGVVDPDGLKREQDAVRWLVGSLESALAAREEIIDQHREQIATAQRAVAAARQLATDMQAQMLEHEAVTEHLKRRIERIEEKQQRLGRVWKKLIKPLRRDRDRT